MKGKINEKPAINLLELIPVRALKWEKSEEGLVVLLKPKFKSPVLTKYLLPRMKNPYFRIKLDFIGSFMWNACDGRRNVQEIGKMLGKEFAEKAEPVFDRLALFLQSLEKNRFIHYKNK